MSIISPPQMSREPRARLKNKQGQNCSAKCWLVQRFFAETLVYRRGRGRREKQAQNYPTHTSGPRTPRRRSTHIISFSPGLPHGSVVKRLPAIAGDMCASLYLRRSQMPQEQQRLCAPATEPVLWAQEKLQLRPQHPGY